MKKLLTIISLVLFTLSSNLLIAAPFGNSKDIKYSMKLWEAMTQDRLVGKDGIKSTPYTGTPPHGAILDTIDSTLTVDGYTGMVIIKKNFGGEDLTKTDVANNPSKHLKAVTVMFKRENGYDSENMNWFYAKYKPDGSLHVNGKKMQLAGRVAKGNNAAGCIACHKAAPGGDYIFNYDLGQR
ncbi:MAG: cytochrome P460 family protein [Proteobacteria bacterium]|nr:cytochrome P460 family protein [Pseudomonadota bacterium]